MSKLIFACFNFAAFPHSCSMFVLVISSASCVHLNASCFLTRLRSSTSLSLQRNCLQRGRRAVDFASHFCLIEPTETSTMNNNDKTRFYSNLEMVRVMFLTALTCTLCHSNYCYK